MGWGGVGWGETLLHAGRKQTAPAPQHTHPLHARKSISYGADPTANRARSWAENSASSREWQGTGPSAHCSTVSVCAAASESKLAIPVMRSDVSEKEGACNSSGTADAIAEARGLRCHGRPTAEGGAHSSARRHNNAAAT